MKGRVFRSEANGEIEMTIVIWDAALPEKRDQAARALHVLPVQVFQRFYQDALLDGDVVQKPNRRNEQRSDQAGPIGQGQAQPSRVINAPV